MKLTVSDGQATAVQSINFVIQEQPDTAAFTIEKAKVVFNFIKKAYDSLTISGRVPLPIGFSADGKKVRVLIGNLDRTSSLTA